MGKLELGREARAGEGNADDESRAPHHAPKSPTRPDKTKDSATMTTYNTNPHDWKPRNLTRMLHFCLIFRCPQGCPGQPRPEKPSQGRIHFWCGSKRVGHGPPGPGLVPHHPFTLSPSFGIGISTTTCVMTNFNAGGKRRQGGRGRKTQPTNTRKTQTALKEQSARHSCQVSPDAGCSLPCYIRCQFE